jgi:hypothetical protein
VVNVTMAGCSSRYLLTNPKDSPADAGKPNCSLFWWKTKAVSNPNAWLLRDSPRSQTNMIHVILQVPLVTCQVSSQNRGTPFHPLVQHYFQHKRNCFMGVPHSDTSICFKFLSYHVDLKKKHAADSTIARAASSVDVFCPGSAQLADGGTSNS